jgi:hypothetical protein
VPQYNKYCPREYVSHRVFDVLCHEPYKALDAFDIISRNQLWTIIGDGRVDNNEYKRVLVKVHFDDVVTRQNQEMSSFSKQYL